MTDWKERCELFETLLARSINALTEWQEKCDLFESIMVKIAKVMNSDQNLDQFKILRDRIEKALDVRGDKRVPVGESPTASEAEMLKRWQGKTQGEKIIFDEGDWPILHTMSTKGFIRMVDKYEWNYIPKEVYRLTLLGADELAHL